MTALTLRPQEVRHLEGRETLQLSARQELAVLADALHALGYADHLAGHITIRQADDTLLCSPWGVQWDELTASDVLRIDLRGNRLEGATPVPPGIPLHLALHERRRDVGVAVHNHARWSGIWAALHELPPVLDQTGGLVDVAMTIVDEFEGAVDEYRVASEVVEQMGSAEIALLANHGVFVLGPTVADAFLRSYVFEWRCRRASEAAPLGAGMPLRGEVHRALADSIARSGNPGFWDTAIRRAVLRRPNVLF